MPSSPMSGSASSPATEPAGGESLRRLQAEIAARLGAAHEARWIAEEALSDPARTAAQATAVAAEMTARRMAGEPLQHVLGHFAFRELDLIVDARALVPRPETEFLVEVALDEVSRLESAGHPVRTLVDLGTGSGAIACSLASELGESDFGERVVYATDSSSLALELAGENVSRAVYPWPVHIVLVLGSFFEALPPPLRGAVDLIVSNPPYLSEEEWRELDPVVADYDPYAALVSGPTGTECLELLIAGGREWLTHPGTLVLEMAPHQADQMAALAEGAGYSSAEVLPDLAGRPRVLVARQ